MRPARSSSRGRRLFVAILVGTLAMAEATRGATQTLSPSTITISDFVPVTLDGTAKTTTATMSNFSVTDTGGVGWHVTVQGTAFAETDGTGQYVTGGRRLPDGSLAMPAPSVSPADGLVVIAAGPYSIDGRSVKVATALAGSTGTYEFTQTGSLTLTVPAAAYARSYRSDITVSVASGP